MSVTSAIVSVRYRQLADDLQSERDALRETVASNGVQLQQNAAEIEQLHDKVTALCVNNTLLFCCTRICTRHFYLTCCKKWFD